MPTKKISKKGTRNRKTNNKKILAAIGLIVAATIAVCVVTLMGGKLLDGFERQRMAQYLKEHYKEEFTVTNLRKEGTGIGVEGDTVADACPVANKDLCFTVGLDREYYDTYPSTLWSLQAKSEIVNLRRDSLHKLEEKNVKVGTGMRLMPNSAVSYRTDAGELPKFSDAVRRYGGKMFYSIAIYDELDYGQQYTLPEVWADIYSLVDYLKTMNIAETSVTYVLGPQNSAKRYEARVTNEDFLQIKNADDIERYFRVIDRHMTEGRL